MHNESGVPGQHDDIVDSASLTSVALAAAVLIASGLLAGACGGEASNSTLPPPARTPSADCVPDDINGLPPTNPDRRIEDIVELMTGERQTGDEDPVEETIDDPNFGGVWGDFQGGIVVAVIDCSEVDATHLARVAGGAEHLRLIEVPYTFTQVDGFRDALVRELSALGVAADVLIESTLTGRHIEVHVIDAGQLPDGFGAAVPVDAFTVVVTDELFTEE